MTPTNSRFKPIDGSRIARTLLILLAFSATFFFGYNKQPAEMGIMAAMGFVLLAFTNLNQFTSFKGAGFEAQMREVKEATDEAKATLLQVQNMSEALAELMAEVVAKHGRWGGAFDPEAALSYSLKIGESLRLMNLEEEKIRGICRSMTRYGKFDLLNDFGSAYRSEQQGVYDISDGRIWDEFVARHRNPSVPELRDLISQLEPSKHRDNLEKVIERIENYETTMQKEYGGYTDPQTLLASLE